ncbi:MAG TPA: hypothetical protein VM409_03670 [Chloroflexia bacterium]|nr:hypothetical protein [Chloroflexia bacterium]
MADETFAQVGDTGDTSYEALLDLEEMESLLEEIEEQEESGGTLAANLSARLQDLGISGVEELKARILFAHAQLDEE